MGEGGPGSRGSQAGQLHRERGEENLTGRWPGRPVGAAVTTNILTPPRPLHNTNTGEMSTRSLNRPLEENSRGTVVTSDRAILQPGSGERQDAGRDPATAAPPPPAPCTAHCVTADSQRKLADCLVFSEQYRVLTLPVLRSIIEEHAASCAGSVPLSPSRELPCPICTQCFPHHLIERHAATCGV